MKSFKTSKKILGMFIAGLISMQLFSYGMVVAQEPTNPIMLQNEQLRFGNGSENSINATGNLQQPFYQNEAGSWRKLTFSNYPLDFEIMEGGDGSDWWNRNGVSSLNPTLASQTFDYSEYVQTDSGGYGTIITSGTLTLNGKLVEVTHEYTLPEDKFLIQITTTLKNLSDTSMTNLRYWVGTRDDYIGNNDSNSKTKGNIVEGQFVAISNQSEQSKALKIFNNNEGVLFYTNSDQANTIVGSRYGWQNIQSRNPVDTPINLSGDNSYAFYVRFDDVAPNQETTLNWYYAAGTIADLDEIIEDVYDSVQLGGNITNDSIEFEINETRDATTYYVIVPADDPEPSQTQIMNGQNSAGNPAESFGEVETQANQQQSVSITNLSPGTQYKLYIVIEYDEEDIVSLDPLEFETMNQYTFTFDTNGGSTIEPITQDAGTTITPPNNPTKMENTFKEWDQVIPTNMPEQDMTFIAQWEVNEYTMTFNSYGDEGVFFTSVDYDNLVQEPAEPTRIGYTFDGWYKEEGLVTEWNFVTNKMPANDIALYAKWIPDTNTAYKVEHYQQNIQDDDYTLVDTEDLQGTTEIVVVPEAKVYDGFDENQTHPERIVSGAVEADGSLVLKRYYDRKEYTVSFKDWDDSLVESSLFRYGSSVVLPDDLTREGYTFDGWDNEIDYVMSDSIVYAKYLSNPTLEVLSSANNLNANVQGLENAVQFSDEERQEKTKTRLEISMYDSADIPANDKLILDDYIRNRLNINDSKMMVLDISLFKLIGDQQTRITKTNKKITISIIVSSDFLDADFKLIRIHNGVAELLDYEFDIVRSVITFSTDSFSTYALVANDGDMIIDLSDANVLYWSWIMMSIGAILVLTSYRKHRTTNK